jgi:hypothetical protein
MISLSTAADVWNAFFHAYDPPLAEAVFRILLGAVLLVNAAALLRDIPLLFGPNGVLPPQHHQDIYGESRFTLLKYLPQTDRWAYACLALYAVSATTLMVGFCTRTSAAVVFVTLLSLQNRNPIVCYGADDVMRLMTFLLIFSRAGDVVSVDSWLGGTDGDDVCSTAWCLRLMQLQVSLIYFKAFLAKFQGQRWIDGLAAYYAVAVGDFQRRPVPRALSHAGWIRFATWSTLAIEFALGPLIWIRELRPAVLVSGVALHAGMEVFMNLHLFGATMLASLVLFVDPLVIVRLLSGIGVM